MIWIQKTLPQIKEIQIEDDTFTCERQWVLELCSALRGKGIVWSCCSPHDLPGDVLAKMKEAGVRNLVVGFESGNDDILKRVRKGVNTQQAKEFMKECRQVGLRVHGCFVFGLPGETLGTMLQTLEFALKLRPDTVQFAIASAYEGTAFNKYLREHCYLRDSAGVTSAGNLTARYDYPDVSRDAINAFAHKAWKSYYWRPSTILRQIHSALTNLQDAKRFARGFTYLGQYMFMNQPHEQ
jgi:radical SAM superfamily enzyme YgiQ (UPF0313 family)